VAELGCKVKVLHRPVLLDAVMLYLAPKAGESYFDATAGYGGHAEAVLKSVGSRSRAVLVDRDSAATLHLEKRFGERAEIRRANFADAAADLVDDGSLFDLVLLDLGVSSPQLDDPERGFSFAAAGPLDMRMDRSEELTAAEIINRWKEPDLAKLIYELGEEPAARKIARAIVAARPIETTARLASVIAGVAKSSKRHPATRTFQALRMKVNEELESLERALPNVERLLAPGGRLAVISFHSLEDRMVKGYFDRQSRDCVCPASSPECTCHHKATLAKLTHKAIKGSTHDANNPRARSAVLRAARKIIQNKKEAQK
jgi:16S rRNA (cytosine1402-N4)-methyltransferase